MSKTKYIVFTANVATMQSAKLRQIITDCVNQKYDGLYFLISSRGGDVSEERHRDGGQTQVHRRDLRDPLRAQHRRDGDDDVAVSKTYMLPYY